MIDHILRFVVPAAYSLLPSPMDSPRATAQLLAIGLQETKFLDRHQRPAGTACGFWQFEIPSVTEVMTNPRSRPSAETALRALRYHAIVGSVPSIQQRLADHDTLACVFARLLLWTIPDGLPRRNQPDRAWQQYLSRWHPGRPHVYTWPVYFEEAWDRVTKAKANGPVIDDDGSAT
jgi:hypothetical protein